MPKSKNDASFNSIKVQLELLNIMKKCGQITCFNSIKVQLERRIGYIIEVSNGGFNSIKVQLEHSNF